MVDRPDWAFANIARNLRRHLSDRYEFLVVPQSWTGDLVRSMLATRDMDLLHFFWRGDARTLFSDEFRTHAGVLLGDVQNYLSAFVEGRRVTTAVYDHLFLQAGDVQNWRQMYQNVTAYYTCSPRLDDIYREIADYPAPTAVLPDGVDLNLFRPLNLSRFREARSRPLVVGWAGNSRWSSVGEDPKGFHSILLPVLARLRDQGFAIEGRFADRMEGFRPHASMPDYYATIDVYVCPSLHEGTPNPVLEAMACGVPVISTDVGLIPDVLGPQQKEFVLPDRSQDALEAALLRVIDEPDVLMELSRENLASIPPWDWSHRARAFQPFFDAALDVGV